MNHNPTNSEENDHHTREIKQKINISLELEKEFPIRSSHSTATEDLMYSIETNFSYISECDIDAIRLFYDSGNSSQVACEI